MPSAGCPPAEWTASHGPGGPVDDARRTHVLSRPPPGRRPRARPPQTQLALLEADPAGWRRTLERLLDDAEDQLDAVRQLEGPERDQVVADFEAELARLEAAYDLLTRVADPVRRHRRRRPRRRGAAPGVVGGRRRSSCGPPGPDAPPADNDELADRLEAIGGPDARLEPARRRRRCPTGAAGRRARRSPSTRRSAGSSPSAAAWAAPASGASVTWLGRVAVEAVRLVARGAVVPDAARHQAARTARRLDLAVRWAPALVDAEQLDELDRGDARRRSPLLAPRRRPGHHARGARRRRRRHRPRGRRPARAAGAAAHHPHRRRRWPRRSSPASTARRSRRPVAAGAEVSKRLDRWAQPVTGAGRAAALVVQLDPPDSGDAWFLSVLGPGAEGGLLADRAGARRQPGHHAARRRARPPRAAPARAAAARRPAPRPGVPEPGRGLGADDRHRRRRSRPPASRCGCRRCRAASRRPALRCSPSPPARRWSAPTSSATCAGRRCSTTSS